MINHFVTAPIFGFMYLINEIHFGIFHVNSHFEGKSRKGLFT